MQASQQSQQKQLQQDSFDKVVIENPKKAKDERMKIVMAAEPDQKYLKPSPKAGITFPEENFIEFYVTQEKKRIKLNTYLYSPPNQQVVKAIFLVYHGMNSHIGNFAHIAKSIAESGIAVLGYDQRGFGKSEGIRGFIESVDQHIQDATQFVDLVQKKYGNNIPIFVGGQSLGGATAFKLCVNEPQRFKGAVLFAPAIKDNTYHASFGKKLVKCLGSCVPKMKTVPQGQGGANKNPQIGIDISKDPQAYTGRVIPGTVKEILKLQDQCYTLYEQFKTPFMVIQGGMDKIVDSDLADELMHRSPAVEKKKLFYENVWHNVWMEDEIYDIMPKMNQWMGQMLEASQLPLQN